MKHFRIILTVTRVVVALLFAANVVFMVQLYNSIKERYLDDVMQCLTRADQIEIVDRIIDAGGADSTGALWLEIGLQKTDIKSVTEAAYDPDYSQGYRRVDRQILSVITRRLHENYGARLGDPDFATLKKAFAYDLAFAGLYPDQICIVPADAACEHAAGLWHIAYSIGAEPVYDVYISPLTGAVLREMSGVLVSSALIALVLTFGFWYLLHVIDSQRSLEEMKDDFTNNMTHELKTPIAIAYAANDSLLQFPDPADTERTRSYLTAALEQLSRLSGLVENILAMSMERRRNLTMHPEEIELKPFLESIMAQQKLRAAKQCVFSIDCPDGLTVTADPTHFSNIVTNLIDNSLKYSGESVTVAIRADAASLSVTDNGIGIPEKSIPLIFNKFYRVPHGDRTDVHGYGIGLYYVRTIVEKHGWSISAESRQGKGSVFTIKFLRR